MKKILPFIILLPSLYIPLNGLPGLFTSKQTSVGIENILIAFVLMAIPVLIYIYTWYITNKVTSRVVKIFGLILAWLIFFGFIGIDIIAYGMSGAIH
jgi:hypothetical protein